MGCIGQICPVLIFWSHGHIKRFLDMERLAEGKRESIVHRQRAAVFHKQILAGTGWRVVSSCFFVDFENNC